MTDEQINIAIAKACGWTDCSNVDGSLCGLPAGVTSLNGRYSFIPDYCNDLNAMHEAEKRMNRKVLWEAYKAHLLNWMTEPVCASARQRAEAFLKTINKWEGWAMSKTPLTDHYTKRLRNLCDDEFVPIEFARKLERELVAVTEQRDEYKGLLIELHNDINVIHSGNAIAKLNRMFKEENYN